MNEQLNTIRTMHFFLVFFSLACLAAAAAKRDIEALKKLHSSLSTLERLVSLHPTAHGQYESQRQSEISNHPNYRLAASRVRAFLSEVGTTPTENDEAMLFFFTQRLQEVDSDQS
jgi:hypothetical protein